MKELKVFAPFGLIFLASASAIQAFNNILTFQNIGKLLLKKVEINIQIQINYHYWWSRLDCPRRQF